MAQDLVQTEFGKFYIKEVYIYYDGPKLFLCTDASEMQYMSVAIDEDDISEKWLYAPISNTRLSLIKNKSLPLRKAFTNPESGWLFTVNTYFDTRPASMRIIRPDQILPDELPDGDVYLQSSNTEQIFVSSEVYLQPPEVNSLTQLCNTIDLHIHPPQDIPPGVIAVNLLGQTISRFQSLVYSVMHPLRGRIPVTVQENGTLFVTAFARGSFQVRVQQIQSESMFQNNLMTEAMQQCFDLLISTDRDKLISNSASYKLFVLDKYQRFLEALAAGDSGIKVKWASPDGVLQHTDMSSDQIKSIISYFKEEKTLTSREFTVRGFLTMVDTNRRKFTLSDGENDYRGTVSDTLRGSIFEVSWDNQNKYVEAILEETVDLNVITDDERISYLLIGIKYI